MSNYVTTLSHGIFGAGGPAATLPIPGHVWDGAPPYGLEDALQDGTRRDALIEWVLSGKEYGDPADPLVGTLGAVPCGADGVTALEVAQTQAAQVLLFRDACKIGFPNYGGADPQVSSWTYGAEIKCGEDTSRPTETVDGADVTITDGSIRVPNGTLVDSTCRIQLTKRDLAALATPEYYAVVGAPQRGLSCTVCRVKVITGRGQL